MTHISPEACRSATALGEEDETGVAQLKQTQTYDTTENGNVVDDERPASLIRSTGGANKQSGETSLEGTESRSRHHHSSSDPDETLELDLFNAQPSGLPLTGSSWMIMAVANALLLQR